MEIIKTPQKNLQKILKCLGEGGAIICPTDTVYGLLADATNKKAAKKVFQIKHRSLQKPVPVFVENIEMAKKLAFVNKKQAKFLRRVWPGKVTVVLYATELAKSILPKGVIGKDNKIGIRIPDYELVNRILEKLKKPLTATSANISGKPALIKAEGAVSHFKNSDVQPDLVLDAGELKKSKPSTVVDLTSSKPKILRK